MSIEDFEFFVNVSITAMFIVAALCSCGIGLLSAAQVQFKFEVKGMLGEALSTSRHVSLEFVEHALSTGGFLRISLMLWILASTALYSGMFEPRMLSLAVIISTVIYLVCEQIHEASKDESGLFPWPYFDSVDEESSDRL